MKTRRLTFSLILLASILLTACKQEPEAADTAEGPGPGPFSGEYNRKSLNGATDEKLTNPGLGVGIKLASTSFREGQAIPARHACTGQDVSPPLAWINLPAGTRSLALLLEDPDAENARGGDFTHWLIYNIPPEISILPEDLGKSETLSLGALQGRNDFQNIGYGGPCPPPGAPHRYRFRVFALDTMLTIVPGSPRPAFDKAITGHVLGQARLSGSFGR